MFSWSFHTASFWNNTIQWTSHDDLTEISAESRMSRFFVKSQSAVMNFCHLTSFSFWYQNVLAQTFKHIYLEVLNAWMDPHEKKNIYYNTFYSIYCRLSPFHCEWLALTKIIMIWTFSQKAYQNFQDCGQLRPFTVKRT